MKNPRRRLAILLSFWGAMNAVPGALGGTGSTVSAHFAEVDEGRCPGTEPLVLRTRLEKTFLRIDVLDLELRVGGEAAERVRQRIASRGGEVVSKAAALDSIARILIDARCADAAQVFLRNVGYKRFLEAIGSNMRRAREAGILSEEDERRIAASLPASYSFLERSGIAKGDRMHYEVRGDCLRILYVDAQGVVRLDRVDEGAAHRLALLGGFLAPGSDFRDGLLRSLLDED